MNSDEQRSGEAPREQPSVLLVEDNANNRRVVELMLRHLGIEPTVAEDGRCAVAAVEQQRFDLILMDLRMPHMDGFEAARRIRAIEAEQGRPHTPIMAVTANTLPEDRAASSAAGMDDFIVKPVTRGPFLDRVDHWLQGESATAEQAGLEGEADAPVNQAFDLRVLARLGQDVGEELIPELLSGFAEDLEAQIGNLPRLASTEDYETLTRAAHSLKSSAATFGAAALSAAALDVESRGRQQQYVEMTAALPLLLEQMRLALRHMPAHS